MVNLQRLLPVLQLGLVSCLDSNTHAKRALVQKVENLKPKCDDLNSRCRTANCKMIEYRMRRNFDRIYTYVQKKLSFIFCYREVCCKTCKDVKLSLSPVIPEISSSPNVCEDLAWCPEAGLTERDCVDSRYHQVQCCQTCTHLINENKRKNDKKVLPAAVRTPKVKISTSYYRQGKLLSAEQLNSVGNGRIFYLIKK